MSEMRRSRPEAAEPVVVAIEGPVARLTLNRPAKRNAVNDAIPASISPSSSTARRTRCCAIRAAGTR